MRAGSAFLFRFTEQLERRHFQGLGDPLETVEGEVLFTSLDRADVGPMEAACGGESLLGVARRTSQPPYRLPYPESKRARAGGA